MYCKLCLYGGICPQIFIRRRVISLIIRARYFIVEKTKLNSTALVVS